MTSVLDRCGLVAIDDPSQPETRALFDACDTAQRLFLAEEGKFRGEDYKWPSDPLRTWSRVFEYPYVLHHLRGLRRPEGRAPSLVDLGSGVTFFPFLLAREGFEVTCVDIDPVAERDLRRAAEVVPMAPGRVDFRRTDGRALPFETASLDALCCVSVLEHVPDPATTTAEIGRVLRPGGLFVLTIDLDLTDGRGEIGPQGFTALLAAIERDFERAVPERTTHPRSVLTSTDGPFPLFAREAGLKRTLRPLKEAVKPALGRAPWPHQHLACWVGAFVRRA